MPGGPSEGMATALDPGRKYGRARRQSNQLQQGKILLTSRQVTSANVKPRLVGRHPAPPRVPRVKTCPTRPRGETADFRIDSGVHGCPGGTYVSTRVPRVRQSTARGATAWAASLRGTSEGDHSLDHALRGVEEMSPTELSEWTAGPLTTFVPCRMGRRCRVEVIAADEAYLLDHGDPSDAGGKACHKTVSHITEARDSGISLWPWDGRTCASFASVHRILVSPPLLLPAFSACGTPAASPATLRGDWPASANLVPLRSPRLLGYASPEDPVPSKGK